jgi:hypothetical protein
MDKVPQFFDEQEYPEGIKAASEGADESRESSFRGLFEAAKTGAERAQKWISIMAAASMLSGGAMAGEKRSKLSIPVDNGARREHVEAKKAPDIAFEARQMLIVENLCKDAGFDIDQYDGAVQMNLPPKPVSKVFINIGQTHRAERYTNNPSGKKYVVQKQKLIFDLLRTASLKTHKQIPCLNEGVVSEEAAEAAVLNEKSEKKYREYVSTVVSSGESLKDETKHQVNTMNARLQARPEERYPELTKNLYFFDMVRLAENDINSRKTGPEEKMRLRELSANFSAQADIDLLTYEMGGVGIAARCGYVKVMPAENEKAYNNVMVHIQKEVGFVVPEGANMYDIIKNLPKEKRERADEAIARFGTSKEREMGTLHRVQDGLKNSISVVLVYGDAHDFNPEFDELQEKGTLDDVAMVKIDTDLFDLAEDADKK